MGALFDLVCELEQNEGPSDAWIAEHAPDGRLDALWVGDEALWMARLAARVSARREQVRAAIELARRVARHLPRDRRAHRAIERAEAWHEDDLVELGPMANDVWAVEVGGPLPDQLRAQLLSPHVFLDGRRLGGRPGHRVRDDSGVRCARARGVRASRCDDLSLGPV